jgi:hypothetical protein
MLTCGAWERQGGTGTKWHRNLGGSPSGFMSGVPVIPDRDLERAIMQDFYNQSRSIGSEIAGTACGGSPRQRVEKSAIG